MIAFNFSLFLFEKRKSIADISKLLNMPFRSLSIMLNRGTVKPSFIEKLETHFGDCSKYIVNSNLYYPNVPAKSLNFSN